ncbi:hypothetical protein FA13DRAFT_1735260, partial [Coprinellus micaceus]
MLLVAGWLFLHGLSLYLSTRLYQLILMIHVSSEDIIATIGWSTKDGKRSGMSSTTIRPPEPDGSPVFSLDFRPALDNFGSVQTRIAAATEEVWSSFRKDQGLDRA